MVTALFVRGSETGAKAQNAEFFASDITTGSRAGKGLDLIIEVTISAGTTPNIEISFDSGATWTVLISALALNTFTRVRVVGASTDTINFRTPTVGGLTLARFLVTGDLDA